LLIKGSRLSTNFGEKMGITGIEIFLKKKSSIDLNDFVRVVVIVIGMQVDSAGRVLCRRLQAQPCWSSIQGLLNQRRNCWVCYITTLANDDSLMGLG